MIRQDSEPSTQQTASNSSPSAVQGVGSKNPFASYYKQGLAFYKNGQYRQAKDEFLSATVVLEKSTWDNEYTDMYYRLCYTRVMLKESKTYMEYLRKSIYDTPTHSVNRMQLIILLTMEHQDTEAQAQFLVLKSTNWVMANSLGNTLRQHGVKLD